MSSFSLDDFVLELSNDWQELKVVDSVSGVLEDSFDLDSAIRIQISNNAYQIESADCSSCFEQAFDKSNGDTITFNSDQMFGVTIVRIECRKRIFTYSLGECPVYLIAQNDVITIKGPADPSGTEPDSDCASFSDEDIECP